MLYQRLVSGDDRSGDSSLIDVLRGVALVERDIEDQRVFAAVRSALVGKEHVPVAVGRYRLETLIGAGAMGRVYRAYDPQLDRRVALKILQREEGYSKALQEARALARLSHPNAVTVYEVGQWQGELFIAMELIDGEDLRRWSARQQTPRKTLRVLLEAGAGLAAAHACSIVHGDFKPDNVLVGRDRCRVVDFGLARLFTSAQDNHLAQGLRGTPAYMAPEQLAGGEATPLSDQWAFAATAFEALSGARITSPGASSQAAKSSAVPRAVRPVLARALDEVCEQRYSSIEALLVDLRRRTRPRRRWLVFAVACLVGLAALAAFILGARHDSCGREGERLTAFWNDQTRHAVRAAFLAAKTSRAERTYQELDRAIARYLVAWRAAHRDVCEAEKRRASEPAVLAGRRWCLRQKIRRLSVLTRLSREVRTGAETIAAQKMVRTLSPAEECLSIAAEGKLPQKPSARARFLALQQRIEAGRALYRLGRYRVGRDHAMAILKAVDAKTSDYLHARALLLAGQAQGRLAGARKAVPYLRKALVYAGRANADRLAFRVWIQLLKQALFAGTPKRVVQWAPFARAAAARARQSDAQITAIVGEALLFSGKVEKAEQTLSVAAKRLVSQQRSPRFVAVVYANLAKARLQQGKLAAAERDYRQALRLARRALADDHPGLAFYLERLGRLERRKGRLEQVAGMARRHLEQALTYQRRALAMRQAAYGRSDRAVASSLLEISKTLLVMGKLKDAKTGVERALKIREQTHDAAHPAVAGALEVLGDILFRQGAGPKAKTRWKRALAIWRKVSKEHPKVEALQCRLSLLRANAKPSTLNPCR
jgi:tetratricopeptide (TPR) repeat protein/predicted Ser/Thr protein kinase